MNEDKKQNERKKNLTHKEEIWCIQFLNTGNKTKAAIIAGYSKKSARRIGWENSTKPHIQQRLNELTEERRKRLDYDEEKIKDELAAIAFQRYLDITGLEPSPDRKGWFKLRDLRELPDHINACIKKIEKKVDIFGIYYNVEFHDKISALKLLMETEGMLKRSEDDGVREKDIEIMKQFAEALIIRDTGDTNQEPKETGGALSEK